MFLLLFPVPYLQVFEGPAAFLNTLASLVDDLCVSAAGLGLRVDCFMSESKSQTVQHVLRVIHNVRKLFAEDIPPLAEAETEAEAALSSFATLNPISAWAVLSSGFPFRDFLALTREQQEHATARFGLSKKALNAFMAELMRKKSAVEGEIIELAAGSSGPSIPADFSWQVENARDCRLLQTEPQAAMPVASNQRSLYVKKDQYRGQEREEWPAVVNSMHRMPEMDGNRNHNLGWAEAEVDETQVLPCFPSAADLVGTLEDSDDDDASQAIRKRRCTKQRKFNTNDDILWEGDCNEKFVQLFISVRC